VGGGFQCVFRAETLQRVAVMTEKVATVQAELAKPPMMAPTNWPAPAEARTPSGCGVTPTTPPEQVEARVTSVAAREVLRFSCGHPIFRRTPSPQAGNGHLLATEN